VTRLVLPKTAFNDIRLLLTLDEGQLRALSECFATAESIAIRKPEFIKNVSERIGLDMQKTGTLLMVCSFLLSVADEGTNPEEIVNNLREFVTQYAPTEDKEILAAPDKMRQGLISLLTPKPARIRAVKVEYLAHGPHPTVDSFRTICDLRPVFERTDGKEAIVGYVPTILLEAKVSDLNGEQETVLLYLTSDMLESLKTVVERTSEKMEAIRAKFGRNLLHD